MWAKGMTGRGRPHRLRPYWRVAVAFAAALLISGCGGSRQGAQGGRVQVAIAWPEYVPAGDSRYLPPYAASLVFELTKADDPTVHFTLVTNRPDSGPSAQTVEFNTLIPAGIYTLAAVAR